jgi:hypothetical protein
MQLAELRNVTEEKKNTGVRPAKFQDSGVLQVLCYTMHGIFCGFFARLAAGQLDNSILGSLRKLR